MGLVNSWFIYKPHLNYLYSIYSTSKLKVKAISISQKTSSSLASPKSSLVVEANFFNAKITNKISKKRKQEESLKRKKKQIVVKRYLGYSRFLFFCSWVRLIHDCLNRTCINYLYIYRIGGTFFQLGEGGGGTDPMTWSGGLKRLFS